jgi:hypothetical protein
MTEMKPSKADMYDNKVPYGLLSSSLQIILQANYDKLLAYDSAFGKWIEVNPVRLNLGTVYRTIKPKPKPREFWINASFKHLDVSHTKPNNMEGYIHVREVIE